MKVAKESKTFKIADVMRLTQEAVNEVPPQQWSSVCIHCEKIVDEFWKMDGLQEQATAKLTIELCEEDEDEADEDDSDDEDDSNEDDSEVAIDCGQL